MRFKLIFPSTVFAHQIVYLSGFIFMAWRLHKFKSGLQLFNYVTVRSSVSNRYKVCLQGHTNLHRWQLSPSTSTRRGSVANFHNIAWLIANQWLSATHICENVKLNQGYAIKSASKYFFLSKRHQTITSRHGLTFKSCQNKPFGKLVFACLRNNTCFLVYQNY